MRVRRAQQLEMKETFGRNVERVARAAADDGRAGRRRHASAASVPRVGVLDLTDAADGALDRAIAGAAANVAFERPCQIVTLGLVQACGGEDHARRAEAALKALGLQE